MTLAVAKKLQLNKLINKVSTKPMQTQSVNKLIIIALLLLISLLFIGIIKNFLITLLLAAVFAALSYPLYEFLLKITKGRPSLSAAISLILLLVMVFIPLIIVSSLIIDEALYISSRAKPWIQNFIESNNSWTELVETIPYLESLQVYKNEIVEKLGATISSISSVLFQNISSITVSTLTMVLMFLIFLYSFFFFLRDGEEIMNKALYYFPLSDREERRILDQFTSVTRATLKGTVIVGIIQGSLAGFGFWVVGIEGALFWTAIMIILSIVPLIGSVLIWLPAAIILALLNQYWEAIFLIVYSSTVVSLIDNILRPKLVGRDTKMHELLIFLSTLGGIGVFGIFGFIIGPIIAALFITMLEIYGKTFNDFLPEVHPHKKPPAELSEYDEKSD
ncbi:MAG: AI-2E family transporter [Pseudomonadota bacterium]|nr:AI-2E family transporter [Pseudomonadota bacterium]